MWDPNGQGFRSLTCGSLTPSSPSSQKMVAVSRADNIDIYVAGFLCTPFTTNGKREDRSCFFGSGTWAGKVSSGMFTAIWMGVVNQLTLPLVPIHQSLLSVILHNSIGCACPYPNLSASEEWAAEAAGTFWACMKTIASLRPRCFVLENVVPISNNSNSAVTDAAFAQLISYRVIKVKASSCSTKRGR